MNKNILIGFLLILLFGCRQTDPDQSTDAYFELVRNDFTGDLAYKTTAFVEQFWRVAGNTGFNESIYWITRELEKSGYQLESDAPTTAKLTYRIEKRALKNATWEPVNAALTIVGQDQPLLESTTNRNMTYLNSVSTPENGISAQVIQLTSDTDLTKITLKNKIIFTELRERPDYKLLLEKGAFGVVSYNNPDYLQPEKNSTSIQFRGLPPQKEDGLWGIALSYDAKEILKEAFKKGPVELLVKINTKIYASEELTVIANVKGSELPEERLVFSAHVQEPGANDNASGVGVQLEMAAITAKLLIENKIEVKRTLTFLWGDEIISTRRYIQEDPSRASQIKWGISLDMVGENTAVTGGSFLIEKMPDPSAIWTRGSDNHTEWGGEVLSLKDMKPHYLNDFIIQIFKKQGAFADWKISTNPFEGGSDHTPFLEADIPGLLLWHFTDQFYHTDNDRIDKVSQSTLRNVGIGALVSAYTLINANKKTAHEILLTLKRKAHNRIKQEFELSAESISNGSSLKQETAILRAWEDWYNTSFSTVLDMATDEDKTLKQQILNAQNSLSKKTQDLIRDLQVLTRQVATPPVPGLNFSIQPFYFVLYKKSFVRPQGIHNFRRIIQY